MKIIRLTGTCHLALLLGWVYLGFAEFSYGATPQEFDNIPLVLVIRHIGAEDRSIPPLLLYSQSLRVRLEQYGCAKAVSCFSISSGTFSQLARALNSRFFSVMSDDTDLKPAGSFEFAMESPNNRKTLRLGKVHSAEILKELLKSVKDLAIRTELDRRLSITRI